MNAPVGVSQLWTAPLKLQGKGQGGRRLGLRGAAAFEQILGIVTL
jgi:hypothetical protein